MTSDKKPKVIFLIGGPGSGKGTVCEKILINYPFNHLSTGDLLRNEVKKQSEIGKLAENYMKEGKMVPGEKLIEIIKISMNDMGWSKGIFILDGFPRNFENIEFWKQIMKDEIDELGVIYLECTPEVMKERILKRGLTSGRSDDNEEAFNKRIEVFFNETTPVVEYFKNQNKLFSVNVNGTQEEAFEGVRSIIDNFNLQDIIKVINLERYLHKEVDPYMKSLLKHLYKHQPKDIYLGIKEWLENEGAKIQNTLTNENN